MTAGSLCVSVCVWSGSETGHEMHASGHTDPQLIHNTHLNCPLHILSFSLVCVDYISLVQGLQFEKTILLLFLWIKVTNILVKVAIRNLCRHLWLKCKIACYHLLTKNFGVSSVLRHLLLFDVNNK